MKKWRDSENGRPRESEWWWEKQTKKTFSRGTGGMGWGWEWGRDGKMGGPSEKVWWPPVLSIFI